MNYNNIHNIQIKKLFKITMIHENNEQNDLCSTKNA